MRTAAAPISFANTPLTIAGTYSYIATSPGLISAVAFESVAPFITAISPTAETAGGPAFNMTLTGNFTSFLNNQDYYVCFKSPSAGSYSTILTGSTTVVAATVPAQYIAQAGVAQVFIGDIYCGVQNSNSVVIQVANPEATTATALAITPATVAYGKPVTLTATVKQATASLPIPVTLGRVVFCNFEASLCSAQFNIGSAQLNAAGVATLPIYPGVVGVHSYQALFLGTLPPRRAPFPQPSQ